MSDFQKAKQLYIYPGNCIRRISPLTDCHICEDVCPQGTLLFQGDTPEAPNCNLCGLCVALCPTQVFSLDQFRLFRLEEKKPLAICCSEDHSAPEDALRINCLQQLSPLSLLYLIYQHGSVTVYVPEDTCAGCTHHWYSAGLAMQMAQYHLPDDTFRIITHSGAPAAIDRDTRRNFFAGMLQRTEDYSQKKAVEIATRAAKVLSPESTATEESHEIMPMRLPLYAMYVKKKLSVPEDTDAELPFRGLTCHSCSFCGACSRMCPTEALTMTEQDNTRALEYHPELCIGCRICTSSCMEKGLEWTDFLTPAQFLNTPVALAQGTEKECSSCGHSYYIWPEEEDTALCRFCR